FLEGISTAISEVENQPTVETIPVMHGKWIFNVKKGYGTMKCSECGTAFAQQMIPFKFCPNCGAKMDGETEGGK
ncbi:MAG: hypothetical protein WCT05_08285, partial [Lentisphaeria bacterium]